MESLAYKLTDTELHRLFLRRKARDLRQLFGMKDAGFRAFKQSKSLLSGLEYLKMSPQHVLREILVDLGSYREMAKYYSVSESFVKGLFERPHFEPIPPPTKEQVQDLLTRCGSPSHMAVMLCITTSELSKLMELYGLEKPKTFDFHSSAAHYFGRRGETDFLAQRKLGPECDMTHKDPNHPFDVLDPLYGRVNVKASRCWLYKNKKLTGVDREYHKFDLSGLNDCDAVALMFYDRSDNLALCAVMTVELAKHLTAKTSTLIVSYKNRHHFTSFGNPSNLV